MKTWPTLEAWVEMVDARCVRELGYSLDDLPDLPLEDWWMDQVSPAKASDLICDLVAGGLV